MGFGSKQIGEYKNSLIRFFDLFEVNTTQSSKVALLESFYIVYKKLGVRQSVTSKIYNKILNQLDREVVSGETCGRLSGRSIKAL